MIVAASASSDSSIIISSSVKPSPSISDCKRSRQSLTIACASCRVSDHMFRASLLSLACSRICPRLILERRNVRSSVRAAVSFCSIITSRTSFTVRSGPFPLPKARRFRAPTSGCRQVCRSRASQLRIFSITTGDSGSHSSDVGAPLRSKPQSSLICLNIVA